MIPTSITFPRTTINGKLKETPLSNIIELQPASPITPNTVNGKVPPPRRKNADVRSREHLTPDEVERLVKAAKSLGRHQHRDSTLLMMMFRHGLRVSEAVSLKWDAVNLNQSEISVSRLKNGKDSVHPLTGVELRALRKLKRDYPNSTYLFTSERGAPLTTSTVRKMVSRASDKADLGLSVHPHMLRHSTGYYLVNAGVDTRSIQDYLGHKNIQHTVRYTELASGRFKDFWRD